VLNPHHHNPEPNPFRRSRIIPTVLAVAALVLLVLIAMWNAETAQAKRLTGHCGIHFGALYRIDSGGARYRSPRRAA
jgi:hypothetical protein